jgi:hypothetical protein
MTTTIGFFGTGDVSDTINEQLLEDQVLAARGEEIEFILPPLTTEALKFIERFGRTKNIKTYISSTLNPISFTKALSSYENPKLLVLWDDSVSLEEKNAVQFAIDSGIEVRNLCDAVTQVQLKEENMPVPDQGTQTFYTADELAAMDGDEGAAEITRIAIRWGMTKQEVDEAASWDDVADFILARQEEAGSNEQSDIVGHASNESAPSFDEIKAMETPEAQKLAASLWGMSVNEAIKYVQEQTGMERPRAANYAKVITDWLNSTSDNSEPEEESVASAPEEEPVNETYDYQGAPLSAQYISAPEPLDLTPIVEAVRDGFKELVAVIRESTTTAATGANAVPGISSTPTATVRPMAPANRPSPPRPAPPRR